MNIYNRTTIIYALFFVVVLFTLFYETMPTNLMIHSKFDGAIYAEQSKNFGELFQNDGISKYYVQRLLPAFFVWCFFTILNVHITDNLIITSFLFLNLLGIGFIAFFWNKILNLITTSLNHKILGISILLFSFPILKYPLYYPVLNDLSAVLIGTLLLYFHLVDKKTPFILTVFFGSFVFPTTIVIGGLLFCFREKNNLKTKIPLFFKNSHLIAMIVGISLFLFLEYYLIIRIYNFDWIPYNLRSFSNTNTFLYILSLVGVCIFILIICYNFYIESFIYKAFQSIDLKQIGLFLGVVIIIKVGQFLIANNEASEMTIFKHLKLLISTIPSHPFKWLVAHFSYFGVLFIFIFIFFKQLKNNFFQQNIGISLVVLFFITYSFSTESRQFVSFFPFVAYWFLSSVKNVTFGNTFVFATSLSCIILSRFWYPINLAFSDMESLGGHITNFPLQHYFMIHGPWMGDTAYFAQLGVFVVFFIIFWKLSKKDTSIVKN